MSQLSLPSQPCQDLPEMVRLRVDRGRPRQRCAPNQVNANAVVEQPVMRARIEYSSLLIMHTGDTRRSQSSHKQAIS